MRGLFLTGTDTGVGKTTVGCSLASDLHRRGLSVGVMKPVETGCGREAGSSRLVPLDALALAAASGDPDPIEAVCPFVFAEPLAPWVAAECSGSAIDPAVILDLYRDKARRFEFLLVEGAGGLLVPIRRDFFMLDLARAMGLPLLVVAANRLGVLNHTLLTVRIARSSGIPVAGVVLTHPQPHPDPSGPTNAEALARLLDVPLLGVLPHVAAGAATASLDVTAFLRASEGSGPCSNGGP